MSSRGEKYRESPWWSTTWVRGLLYMNHMSITTVCNEDGWLTCICARGAAEQVNHVKASRLTRTGPLCRVRKSLARPNNTVQHAFRTKPPTIDERRRLKGCWSSKGLRQDWPSTWPYKPTGWVWSASPRMGCLAARPPLTHGTLPLHGTV